ncbi:hypothetical protein PFICI_15043 [Pestalotiopsis fici W106-1]|uniref:Uncharacterized protein n=1 Tax=Pestalotiopsis fici (strain W106-1 / CGMCC3.15140) TaxID=1229662 RepID=W3WHR8_PESFW|nr:uncharacterized protein PFICI_15043 [Pestalotiopsis fici W106-1]ETS73438.1 hypothetical protein PFICI_15043 [Pestalotiopsis fici W106-1]
MASAARSNPSNATGMGEPLDLGNNIFLYRPASASVSPLNDREEDITPAPTLVIICTWLGGASTPRVHKYVAGYRARYPQTYILLLRTVFADLAFRSFTALRARLRPARAAIVDILQKTAASSSGRDVLLHVFSHGGCNTALQLMASDPDDDEDDSDATTGAIALVRARLGLVVFDSCPGDASFAHAYQAALISLPANRPLVRALGAPLVGGTVAVIHALQSAGAMRSVHDLRRDLLNPAAFGPAPARLYLYSRGDAVVAAADVLAHADETRRGLGCRVGIVGFEKAEHCALILEDKEKYWKAVQEAWEAWEESEMIQHVGKDVGESGELKAML